MRPSRGLLVAAGFVLLAAGAALAQDNIPAEYLPTQQTECYTCHKPGMWPNAPLRQFGGIQPGENLGAAAETEFAFPVKFRALWTPRGNDPTLVNSTVRLDLTNAPSLSFGGVIPDLDNTTILDMRLEPGATSTTITKSTKLLVNSGTTSLRVEALPDTTSPFPPDITLNIEPGGGAAAISVNANGAGQSELREFTYDELLALPIGNWTVTVSFEALTPGAAPVLATDVTVDLISHASFDLQRVRFLDLPMPPEIRAGQILIKTWPLMPKAAPEAGENVTLSIKGIAHYKHKQAGPPNDLRFIDSLDIPVVAQGETVVLAYETTAQTVEIPNGATIAQISEAVGYASAFLLISSIWSGGMFGMASRRQLNRVFTSAKRRVAFHNFLSYGLMLAAAVHLILFMDFIEKQYEWTLGMIWGNIAILAMAGLGVTGALQVQLIKRWGYGGWRWTHYGLAVGAIVFTLVHMMLDGVNFGPVQQALNWEDPLAPMFGST